MNTKSQIICSTCGHSVLSLLSLFAALFTFASCSSPVLPRDGWESDTHKALCNLIETQGNKSASYDPACPPYAVFDYDNTTLVNDISVTLMIYQIEHLSYHFAPEQAFGIFTAYLPDLDKTLEGIGMSARELAGDLSADYGFLYGARERKSLEEIHESIEYKDFRAKLMALNEGVENTFDYSTWCLWQPRLFSGMTYAQLQELTRESVDYWQSFNGKASEIWDENWSSPDGKVAVAVRKGLVLPKESIELYAALKDNGFDVYICSASLEAIVEAMACEPKYGLGMDPSRVFGIRLEDKQMVDGPFESDYDQTFLEGKSACIRKFMAPEHGGKGPALVAGDSNGDFDMLTAFDDMQLGLLFDCKRSGPIAELISNHDNTYTVQPRYQYSIR